jgi:hypothetical protein
VKAFGDEKVESNATPTDPSVVPPEVHVVGADAWGPKTVNVMRPPGWSAKPPVRVADADDPAPILPDDGAVSDSAVGAATTTVSAIPCPHVDAVEPLFPSPP